MAFQQPKRNLKSKYPKTRRRRAVCALAWKIMSFPFAVLTSSAQRAQWRKRKPAAPGGICFVIEFLQEENESGSGLVYTSEGLHACFCPMGDMDRCCLKKCLRFSVQGILDVKHASLA